MSKLQTPRSQIVFDEMMGKQIFRGYCGTWKQCFRGPLPLTTMIRQSKLERLELVAQ